MSDQARDDLVAAMEAWDAYCKASQPWDEDQSREHCYLACSAFIRKHGKHLLALLDAEPTLEEVLAELEQYGLATLVTISVPDGAPGTYICRVYSHRDKDGMFPIESGFAHSRIEAARECLRRVTE